MDIINEAVDMTPQKSNPYYHSYLHLHLHYLLCCLPTERPIMHHTPSLYLAVLCGVCGVATEEPKYSILIGRSRQ